MTLQKATVEEAYMTNTVTCASAEGFCDLRSVGCCTRLLEWAFFVGFIRILGRFH